MNYRSNWVVLALLALGAGGCGAHRSARAGTDTQADARHVRGDPSEPLAGAPHGPGGTQKPVPGNALSGFTDNRFNSWTLSHRVDMPAAVSKPAE